MRRSGTQALLALAALGALTLVSCGNDGEGSADDGRPTIVVSTDVLGDVVGVLVGELADVVTIMPTGTDPHQFQASARDADTMRRADALVTNGAGFEAGLGDLVDAARDDGVAVYEAISGVDPLPDVADGATDPHFFTDPVRMAQAVKGMAGFLAAEVPALAGPEFRASVRAYVQHLGDLDRSMRDLFDTIPVERRLLVTNHEVFSYFADRYDFEIVGAVIPRGTTDDTADAQALAALADLLRDREIATVFADSSSPARLADALADEVPGVEVVELFSESLGDAGSGGETYLDMMLANAHRIAAALG